MNLITVREAAKVLGVSPDTVRRLIAADRLKSYSKLGEGLHFFLDRAEVQTFKKQEGVKPIRLSK